MLFAVQSFQNHTTVDAQSFHSHALVVHPHFHCCDRPASSKSLTNIFSQLYLFILGLGTATPKAKRMLIILLDAHTFTILVPFFTVLMLLTCAQRDATTYIMHDICAESA